MKSKEFTDMMLRATESRIQWINISSTIYFQAFFGLMKNGTLIRVTLLILISWFCKSLARSFVQGYCEDLSDEEAYIRANELFRQDLS